jgi:hypothetical protein
MPLDPTQVSNAPTPAPTDPVAQPSDQQVISSLGDMRQESPSPVQDAVSAPSDSSSSPTPSASAPSAPAAPGDPNSINFQRNPNRSLKTQPNASSVSNPPAVQPDLQSDPHVQHASRMRAAFEALAGGEHTKISYDDAGNRIVTKRPLTKGEIGFAIALSAIQGSLVGLAAGRGKGPGAAGAAAFQQQLAQKQAGQARQEEQAQQQFANQQAALARRGAVAEANSRTLLNVAEAEKYGADAIDKQVEINRASGALDVDDPTQFENNGIPMTQSELHDAMKAGRVDSTAQIGAVAGREEVTDKDGNKHWQATFLVRKDPNQLVPLSQADWDRYASANVPGFQKDTKIGDTSQVPAYLKARANAIVAAHSLSDFRLNDMRQVLAGTAYADKVPSSIDFSQPGVETAVQRFQKYVSHSNMHGMDVYESLQAMGGDKRDPKTGAMQPNPDAKYVDTVAQSFGGWPVLKAVHDKLESDSAAKKAAAVKRAEGDEELKTARLKVPIQAAAAAAEESGRYKAGGKGFEQMVALGTDPVSGAKLSLDNAPDELMVDTRTGLPIPTKMISTLKPSMQETNRADFAKSAIHSLDALNQLIDSSEAKFGPIEGPVDKFMAAHGLGKEYEQAALNYLTFAQSAATGAHVGGRFNIPIMNKMGTTVSANMNKDQLRGATESIKDVMQQYVDQGGRFTVAQYRELPAEERQRLAGKPQGSQSRVVPPGAFAARNAQGTVVGYKTADGQVVMF